MQHPQVADNSVEAAVQFVRERVNEAAMKSGRHLEDIILLAATKMQDAATINRAIAAGISYIGENRVQELTEKYDQYNKAHCHIHFIGHLQQNKVKYIADKVEMIHSVDSERLAIEINRQCEKLNRIMDILIEVNIGGEATKSGVSIDNLRPLLKKIAPLHHTRIRGLMTIPPIEQNIEETERYFSVLHQEFLDIKAKKLDNVNMDFLSMGMSGDYYNAICCGANLVRVGTALFGARNY